MTIYNILGTINAPQSDPENPTPALYSPALKQEPLKSALTLSPSDLFQKISKGPSTEKKYKLEKFEQQDATKTLDFMNSHLKEWLEEPAGWSSLDDGREVRRIRGKDHRDLPRTLTLVRENGQLQNAYLHFNKKNEGDVQEGSYNKVKIVFDLITQEWAAYRTIKSQTPSSLIDANKQALEEIRLQNTFKGPYIQSVHASGQHIKKDNETHVWSLQPLAHLDAFDWHPQSELEVASFAQHTILALKELHDKGYAYRDLKSENILIYPNGVFKLTDFGLVTPSGELGLCGTPSFLYPFQRTDSRTDDLWALGLLVGEKMKDHLRSHPCVPPAPPPPCATQVYSYLKKVEKHSDFDLDLWKKEVDQYRLTDQKEPKPQTLEHVIWSLLKKKPKKMPSLENVLKEVNQILENLKNQKNHTSP